MQTKQILFNPLQLRQVRSVKTIHCVLDTYTTERENVYILDEARSSQRRAENVLAIKTPYQQCSELQVTCAPMSHLIHLLPQAAPKILSNRVLGIRLGVSILFSNPQSPLCF